MADKAKKAQKASASVEEFISRADALIAEHQSDRDWPWPFRPIDYEAEEEST